MFCAFVRQPRRRSVQHLYGSGLMIVSRGILVVLAMLVSAIPEARAESEQYCFEYLRYAESQMSRLVVAGCPNMRDWWPVYYNQYFDSCREKDAESLEYEKNQRESGVIHCESLAQVKKDGVWQNARELRISGRPGNYIINWTFISRPCSGGKDLHCYIEIALEVPPSRAGGYALQLSRFEPPNTFSFVRADAFPGQAGEVVRLKGRGCKKSGTGSANCEPWFEYFLVMPQAVPEFQPAHIVGVVPERWTPARFRNVDPKGRMQVWTSGATEPFAVRLKGSKDAFRPSAFQDAEGWEPRVRIRLTYRNKTLYDSQTLPYPPDGIVRMNVSRDALNAIQCAGHVKHTGLCATLDVEVDSFRQWTTGGSAFQYGAAITSHGVLQLVTPMVERWDQHLAQGSLPGVVAQDQQTTRSLLGQAPVAPDSGKQPAMGQAAVQARQSVAALNAPVPGQPRLQIAPGLGINPAGQTLTPPVAGGPAHAPVAVARAMGAMEAGTNRYGGDYRGQDLATAQQCQATCASEAQCKAWTWVKPGVQGPSGKCWLKSSVPAPSANACCTSGVK